MEQRLLWRSLLGAVGVAQWVVLALPWVESRDEEPMLDGPLSGWRLLQAGLSNPGGIDASEAFVILALPPLAWLLALGLLVTATVTGVRALSGLTVAGSILAALGVLGLYAVGGEGTHGWSSWDFEPVLFAGFSLWVMAAALAGSCLASSD